MHRLRRLAGWLDARFGIPGTPWRFGLDSLIGLIPGIGDGATAVASLYIVAEGHKLGVRKRTTARMLFNVAVDAVLGLVPLLGDLFDVGWKANLRNVRLIEDDLARRAGGRR